MARLELLAESERKHLEEVPCPTFNTQPWVDAPPLNQARVAIISTAGIHSRDDRPFTLDQGDYYRIIPRNIQSQDLIMSHVSTNFDHSGFQQDWNVAFPIDRLKKLADEGTIAGVAEYHYSFMGAHDPMHMEPEARQLAGLLKEDHVNVALLVPV